MLSQDLGGIQCQVRARPGSRRQSLCGHHVGGITSAAVLRQRVQRGYHGQRPSRHLPTITLAACTLVTRVRCRCPACLHVHVSVGLRLSRNLRDRPVTLDWQNPRARVILELIQRLPCLSRTSTLPIAGTEVNGGKTRKHAGKTGTQTGFAVRSSRPIMPQDGASGVRPEAPSGFYQIRSPVTWMSSMFQPGQATESSVGPRPQRK